MIDNSDAPHPHDTTVPAGGDGPTAPDAGDARDSRVGTVIAGRFRVEGVLGAGGMGAVYRAKQMSVNRAVALKLLHPDLSLHASLVERFRREAAVVAQLAHPNIVTLIDFGQCEDGALYLAMELVAGELLSCVIERDGRIAPDKAVFILRQVLLALEHAHERGIVHRDLKPSNVIVAEAGETGCFVKLLDFGIAKLITETESTASLTKTGVVIGTPSYLAPEQALGGAVDARTDVYAAGLLLYEMLAGRPPFEGTETRDVLLRQIYESPPPLEPDVARNVPPHVRAVVRRAIEKRPPDRFQSAREMRHALVATADSKEAPAGCRAIEEEGARTALLGRRVGNGAPSDVTAARRNRRRAFVWAGAGLVVVGGAVAAGLVYRASTSAGRGMEPPVATAVEAEVRAEPALSREVERATSGPERREPEPTVRPSARQKARETRSQNPPGTKRRARGRTSTVRVESRESLATPVAREAARVIPSPPVAVEPRPSLYAVKVRVRCVDSDKPCWGSVSLDGGAPQNSIVARFAAARGAHTIVVDKEGYRSVSRKVIVPEGPVDVRIDLVPLP